MNKYEIVFIIKADLEESVIKDTVKSFENVLIDMDAKIVNSKEMEQKKLAYPKKDSIRRYYYLLNVEATPKAIKEFDRKALIDEKILRDLIVKEDE